jgi:hypothetical protein
LRSKWNALKNLIVLKIAYIAFLGTIAPTPVHMIFRSDVTRALALGLLGLSLVFTVMGLRRRP